MSDAPRPFERRRADRRRRASPVERQPDESWFGALGVTSDSPTRDDGWSDDGESQFEASWQGGAKASADSRFLSRQARRLINSDATTFERILSAFIAARAALGLALVAALVIAAVFGVSPPAVVSVVGIVYAVQATALWLLPRLRRVPVQKPPRSRLGAKQWLSTIGVDVLGFALLHTLAHGSGLNYVPLFVLPVLMAGVLTPRVPALALAAGVTLILLANAWFALVSGGDATQAMTQAALAGSGFFVIVLLSGELAGRLAREELTARGSLELARQQAQLNRLVIEEMQDGVLVVDRKGRVRAANPAARALLAPSGIARPAPFQLRGIDAWEPLIRAVERAFVEASWPEAGRDVVLPFSPNFARSLRLRVRFTRRREPQASEEFCVLFIEDVRAVQARTRQEKLAAMGRVSAGIAHEIRNPLAAIAQANALLAEDATDPAQRQLTKMVSDNVERLKRIVDDVMEVAPGGAPGGGVVDATALVAAITAEWARAASPTVGDGGVLQVEMPSDALGVVFDAEHLRRVLVNLLDNARRHGGEQPGSIQLKLAAVDERHAQLGVASGGPAIAPEVERFLFEPFFSTRSRGTGLGLYICRELCERYGASIEYRQRPEGEAHRNQFVLAMRREALPAMTAEARSLSTSP